MANLDCSLAQAAPIQFAAATARQAEGNLDSATKRFSLFNDSHELVLHIKVPTISDVSFEVDGILLHARNMPHAPTDKMIIWGELGYLPYSIHSVERRNALIQILEHSHRLSCVKFGVDSKMKIILVGTYEIKTPPSPNYLFEPILSFIQEARPFIKLIATYL